MVCKPFCRFAYAMSDYKLKKHQYFLKIIMIASNFILPADEIHYRCFKSWRISTVSLEKD